MAQREPKQDANATRGRGRRKGCGRAFVLTALAGAARWLLDPFYQGESPYTPFLPSVLAKPIGADALLRAVADALGERAATTVEAAEALPVAPAGAAVDLDAAPERLGGTALLSKLAGQFLADVGVLGSGCSPRRATTTPRRRGSWPTR
jgi:hypothetical protein